MWKIIRPAGEIPLGSTVTKITGTKTYIIQDRIRIFGDEPEHSRRPKEIIAEGKTRFLVAEHGDVNVIATDAELLWHVDEETLRQHLYDKDQRT